MKIFLVTCLLCLGLCAVGCRRETTANLNASNTNAILTRATPTPNALPEPTNAAEAIKQGDALARDNQDNKALSRYKKAIELDADSAEAHFKLAVSYAVQDKDKEALAAYKKAVEKAKKAIAKDPKDATAHAILGRAQLKLNEPQDAVKTLQKAVELDKENTDRHYDLGVAYIKLSKLKEARIAFEKALKLDPDNFRAQEELEKVKESEKRKKDLVTSMEKQMGKKSDENQGGDTGIKNDKKKRN